MNYEKKSPNIYLRLNKEPPILISIRETEIGDLFVGMEDHGASDTKGHVLLRTYSGIVDLFNPCCTWDKDSSIDFKVTKLKKGDKLTLIVK